MRREDSKFMCKTKSAVTTKHQVKRGLANVLACLCLVMAVTFALSLNVLAAGSASVDDAAGLLTSQQIQSLKETAQEMAQEYDLQLFVVTTEDAQGYSAQDYADYYYLRHTSEDDGAVFLIDMDNREVHISTSGVMIRYLTDARIDHLLDRGFEYVPDGEYFEAFEVMLKQTKAYLEAGLGNTAVNVGPKTITGLEALIAAGLALLAGAVLYIVVTVSYTATSGAYHYDRKKNAALQLTRSNQTLVNKFVTHRRIPRNNGGGGGGGHSTTHSTGGHTFGGGGRKF